MGRDGDRFLSELNGPLLAELENSRSIIMTVAASHRQIERAYGRSLLVATAAREGASFRAEILVHTSMHKGPIDWIDDPSAC